MNTQQLFDACTKLSEFASGRHDRRREYEWKVTLGLWAVILGAILSFKDRSLPLWIVVMVAFLYAFLWLRGLWVSNEIDKRVSQHYRKEAEKVLVTPSAAPSSVPQPNLDIKLSWRLFGFLTVWSFQFQLAATLLLLTAAYMFIQPDPGNYASASPSDRSTLASTTLRPAVEERLYFGRGSAGGGVSETGWADFLRLEVTPRFPTGLTVWSADGQWRDSIGTINREKTFVLSVVHTVDSESDGVLNSIVEAYKRRFQQEAVLRVKDDVKISF